MPERFPKPSEVLFVVALVTMTTPAINELLRSIESNNTVTRSCPPLLSESEYYLQKEALQRQMIIPTTRHASLPTIRYIPPEIQLELDELEHKIKDARRKRAQIHATTSGPVSQKKADNAGMVGGIFAFITAGVKELKKVKRA